jgi:hypothetical protein
MSACGSPVVKVDDEPIDPLARLTLKQTPGYRVRSIFFAKPSFRRDHR